jgi:putative tryptophan/tyrosine transport system substrate-binding protein
MFELRRRDFIALICGAVVGWPHATGAQQGERLRRIGVLMDTAESNVEGQARLAAFQHVLREQGWVEGRNIRFDVRWPVADLERAQAYAAELVALAPDAIFAIANAQLRPLSRATRTIPIVFIGASDPVGAGYVESFARPGGNVTGFTLFEASMAGQWLAALKEVAPAVGRVAIMVNPETGTLRGKFYLREFESSAVTLAVEPETVVVHNAGEIEAAIAALGSRRHSGLVVAPDGFTQAHDTFIIELAARHRVPAVFGVGNFTRSGGLMSYGPDFVDVFRRAATYVDRILRGEKPAELPVQAPTKFELVFNLKTAKALGLEVPPMLLARADEVIE